MKHFFTFGFLLLWLTPLSAQLVIQMNSTNVSCFGGNNGSAQASVSGGVSPYSFAWSNGENMPAINSVPAGMYLVTVTDQMGSTAAKSVTVTQPPLLGATLNGQPQICAQAPDGFVYAIPTGGTPPCTYSWSNGIQTQLNNHLEANTYTVILTDTRGCSASGTFTVGYLGLGLYLITDSTAATCPQPDNGSAMVTALSGNGPYDYLWANGATTSRIDNLMAGEYSVTVRDVNGCEASGTVAVEQENVDPNTVEILLPQCTGQTYDFDAAGVYQVFDWMLDDVRDSIVSGQGTSKAWIKWAVAGPKHITVIMRDTTTQCTTSTFFEVDVFNCAVGVQEAVEGSLFVAPNPVQQVLGIFAASADLTGRAMQLVNLQGQCLKQFRITEMTTQLDCTDLNPGIYFLKCADGWPQKTWKIIKE